MRAVIVRAKCSVSFQSEAKNPGFADALIFGTIGLRSGRSVVEGAMVGAEKDPGFFAALRMAKEEAATGCFLLNAGYAKVSHRERR